MQQIPDSSILNSILPHPTLLATRLQWRYFMDTIVLVDDNIEMFHQFQDIFSHLQVTYALQHFINTADGLAFFEELLTSKAPLPRLVMLDRDLPDESCVAMLRAIKQHKRLRAIPVIIFSQFSAPDRGETFYRDGANSYLVIPPAAPELLNTMRLFHDYWLRWSVLPTVS